MVRKSSAVRYFILPSAVRYKVLLMASFFFFLVFRMGPTKDRKGLLPPKRTEKNFRAPKRT